MIICNLINKRGSTASFLCANIFFTFLCKKVMFLFVFNTRLCKFVSNETENETIMRTATITKTLKKVETQSKEYSLGFRRLTVLPKRVRKDFDLAANLKTNWDGKKALDNQKSFLGGLTEQEYVNWLKLA